MKYEFKDLIEASIHTGADRYAIEQEDYEEYNDAIVELHHVYAQAAKADEYEAKAKAFDRICEVMEYNYPTENDKIRLITWTNPKYVVRQFYEVISEYESGESE